MTYAMYRFGLHRLRRVPVPDQEEARGGGGRARAEGLLPRAGQAEEGRDRRGRPSLDPAQPERRPDGGGDRRHDRRHRHRRQRIRRL